MGEMVPEGEMMSQLRQQDAVSIDMMVVSDRPALAYIDLQHLEFPRRHKSRHAELASASILPPTPELQGAMIAEPLERQSQNIFSVTHMLKWRPGI